MGFDTLWVLAMYTIHAQDGRPHIGAQHKDRCLCMHGLRCNLFPLCLYKYGDPKNQFYFSFAPCSETHHEDEGHEGGGGREEHMPPLVTEVAASLQQQQRQHECELRM